MFSTGKVATLGFTLFTAVAAVQAGEFKPLPQIDFSSVIPSNVAAPAEGSASTLSVSPYCELGLREPDGALYSVCTVREDKCKELGHAWMWLDDAGCVAFYPGDKSVEACRSAGGNAETFLRCSQAEAFMQQDDVIGQAYVTGCCKNNKPATRLASSRMCSKNKDFRSNGYFMISCEGVSKDVCKNMISEGNAFVQSGSSCYAEYTQSEQSNDRLQNVCRKNGGKLQGMPCTLLDSVFSGYANCKSIDSGAQVFYSYAAASCCKSGVPNCSFGAAKRNLRNVDSEFEEEG